MKETILVVDDESSIRELIVFNMEKAGYAALQASNAQDALRIVRTSRPSLIVLDLMLPDMSGLDLCRILKGDEESALLPIVMVTARTEESDIVKGLNLGADDYITKPFSPRVLLARVQSVLRRRGNSAAASNLDKSAINTQSSVSPNCPLSIDTLRHEVRLNGRIVELSATEFAIAALLASHAGQVFTRRQIIDSIKGDDYPVTERAIDVQVLGIRKALGDEGAYLIETIRGVGYRMKEFI